MNFNEVLKKIDENTFLTNEVKEDVKWLLKSFDIFFPNHDYSTVGDLFKTLNIKKTSKFLCRAIVEYDDIKNCININEEKVKENDATNAMMFGILEVISNKKNVVDHEKAFNSGMNAMIANNLVGNSTDYMICEDEYIINNLIADIVGMDTVFKAYETKNLNLVVNKLEESGNDLNEISGLLNKMGYNYVFHSLNEGMSSLAYIQAKLVKMFLNNPNLTEQMISDFESKLVTNPNYFVNPFSYSDLANVKTYFNSEVDMYNLNKQQNVGMVK